MQKPRLLRGFSFGKCYDPTLNTGYVEINATFVSLPDDETDASNIFDRVPECVCVPNGENRKPSCGDHYPVR